MSLICLIVFGVNFDYYIILCHKLKNNYYVTYFIPIMSIIFIGINYCHYVYYGTIISHLFNQIYYVT
jgi:hypothetical protein